MKNSDKYGIEPEFKSEKAKLIMEKNPPFIINAGFSTILTIFIIMIIIMMLFKTNPIYKVEVIINNTDSSGKVSGFVLLPKKKLSFTTSILVVNLDSNYKEIFSECRADTERKEIYVRNNQVYWGIPIYMEVHENHIPNIIIAKDGMVIDGFIKLKEKSIFQWVINLLFGHDELRL